jgi:hypothetical protein
MIDALETALLDDMPEVRRAVIWPLAWMRHERTPIILRKSYNLEQNSDVKAEIVRISNSLMAQNAGGTAAERDVAEFILHDALTHSDAKVQAAAVEVQQSRERIKAPAAG